MTIFPVKYIIAALAAASLSEAKTIQNRQIQPGSGLSSWNAYAHQMTINNGKNFGGSSLSWQVLSNTCTELPAAYNDNLGSLQLAHNEANCILYADPFCSGHSYELVGYGESDVIGSGGFGGNGVTTIRCWPEYGAVPTVSLLAHNVYYCTGTYYMSDCTYQLSLDGGCTEIPEPYSNNIGSFMPPQGVYCEVYSSYFCMGAEFTTPSYGTSVTGNAVVSFKCFNYS